MLLRRFNWLHGDLTCMKKIWAILFVYIGCFTGHAQRTVGLIKDSIGSMEGYVLFAPINSTTTYLIDTCGKLVHTWTSAFKSGQSVYLLSNGLLLRPDGDSTKFFASLGGTIELIDWDSNVIWSYKISDSVNCLRNDVCPLPNGNILAIMWNKKTDSGASEAVRDSLINGKGLWNEKIIETKPIGRDSADIVWEWSAWDHLIQDHNPAAANYGVVSKNPQRLNINFYTLVWADWLHFNSIAYNSKLDQIKISSRNFSEFIIIDHSTTKSQAASHNWEKRDIGGDSLYHRGNPTAYGLTTKLDQKLFLPHHTHWINDGLEDWSKIMVFSNGLIKAERNYSHVDIINVPIACNGNYKLIANGKSLLPLMAEWGYKASTHESFYSRNASSAQRLPNGNTLLCSVANGEFFEINKEKNIVWIYKNPVKRESPVSQGTDIRQKALVFRCTFCEASYSGFINYTVISGQPIELNSGTYN